MRKFLQAIRNLLSRPHTIFYAAGITSTIWFLVRVIPKPTRASYPCMRAAAPIMSGFVIYLVGLWGSAFALKRARKSFALNKYSHGFIFLILLTVFLVITATGDIKPSLGLTSTDHGSARWPQPAYGHSTGHYTGQGCLGL